MNCAIIMDPELGMTAKALADEWNQNIEAAQIAVASTEEAGTEKFVLGTGIAYVILGFGAKIVMDAATDVLKEEVKKAMQLAISHIKELFKKKGVEVDVREVPGDKPGENRLIVEKKQP